MRAAYPLLPSLFLAPGTEMRQQLWRKETSALFQVMCIETSNPGCKSCKMFNSVHSPQNWGRRLSAGGATRARITIPQGFKTLKLTHIGFGGEVPPELGAAYHLRGGLFRLRRVGRVFEGEHVCEGADESRDCREDENRNPIRDAVMREVALYPAAEVASQNVSQSQSHQV